MNEIESISKSERIPPHDADAEVAVLGAMMLQKEAIGKAVEIIGEKADVFYMEKHQKIFNAMISLYSKNEPVDLVTLQSELSRIKELDAVGGVSYLTTIMDSVATAANVEHYAKIVLEKAILRQLITVSTDVISECYDAQEPADDLLDKAEAKIFNISENRLRSGFIHLKEPLHSVMTWADSLHGREIFVTGVPSGFADLDEKTSGFQKSDLIIIAGRPSMGKTAFALNIAEKVAITHNITVGIFSLEMSKEQLVQRMLCSYGKVDANKLRRGKLSSDEMRRIIGSAGVLMEAPIYIDDTPAISVLEMRAKARRLKTTANLGLIIVDYLQLMSAPANKRNISRQEEISIISRSLKALAKELNVPVIALSQLSRAPEVRTDKRPQLSDIRESGCLASDSIIVDSETGKRYTIEELAENKKILPIKTKALTDNLKLEEFTVSNAFYSGIKTVYELKTKSGRNIKATENHKFYTIEGWRSLDNLSAGDKIAIPEKVELNVKNNQMSDNELILLAHLLGNGSILPGKPYHYTSSDMENIKVVERTAKDIFNIDGKIIKQKNWYHIYLTSPYPLTHKTYHPITNWFADLGINRVRAHDKVIPMKVFECSNDKIKLFLKHLWATDGNISLRKSRGRKNSVSIYYSSTSYILSTQVQSLLLRLGIMSKLYATKITRNNKEYRPVYIVSIQGKNDLMKFLLNVGCYGKRGENTLEYVEVLQKIKENPNNGCIDKKAWRLFVEPAKNDANISWRDFAKLLGISYNGSGLFRYGISKEKMKKISRIVDNANIYNLANSDIYWDEIISITKLGKEKTYDITVEGAHNFIANDIIVHNSIEQDADVVLFVFREGLYHPEWSEEDKRKTEIIIGKQRNGPIGTVNLVFFGEYTRFEPATQRHDEF